MVSADQCLTNAANWLTTIHGVIGDDGRTAEWRHREVQLRIEIADAWQRLADMAMELDDEEEEEEFG